MRTVTYKLIDKNKTICLGKVDENNATQVRFDAGNVFDEYPTAVPTLSIVNPEGVTYPGIVERDEDMVTWNVQNSDVAVEGTGEIQLAFTSGNTVVRSYIYTTRINRSIVSDNVPDPVDDWLTAAGEALYEIEHITASASGLPAGSDPTASYEDGVITFGIPQGAQGDPGQDGQDGEDGVSPTVAVTTITGGHTVTITDADGDHAFNVMDGSAGAVIDDTSTAANKVWSASKTNELKSAITTIDEQLIEVTGNLLPPNYKIGSRYVSNGEDTWASNTVRMSFAPGTFLELKQNDIVSIKNSVVYSFSGGYTTDNGSTFTSIANRTTDYTVPADGLYFFNLAKKNDADFTATDLKNGWKYLLFKSVGAESIQKQVDELDVSVDSLNDAVDGVKTSIGYEIAPITPTSYCSMIANTGLSYLGQETSDNGQEASDYIDMTNLYDIARVVTNKTKFGLGSICYYTSAKNFIRRDQPGTSYDFSIYNGETVAWLSIDKTVSNAKYVRFCGDNNRGFKYWAVENGPTASELNKYDKLPFYGKKIVNFGDSIFGMTRPPKDVSSYLANITGATVYNAGFGGCEMSNHADANYNPFSMCNLADAIATGTWTAQETAAVASGMPEYFAETVAMLKSLDFSKIDIATIGYGTNDWNNGTQLDGGTNTDKTYYADALRYSIETLLTAYPNLKIFVCTQTYRFFMNASYEFVDDCTTHTNSQGKTLTDFVDKTIEVANAYNVPYIDNYHIGINKFDRSYYFYPTDGTHPMPIGNKLIAENMANKMF